MEHLVPEVAELGVKGVNFWLEAQFNFSHVITSVLGLILIIFDVGSDFYNGINYMGWLDTNCVDNSTQLTDNITTICKPDIFWGTLTLGLIQLPGTLYFCLVGLAFFLIKEFHIGCVNLACGLFFPYPLVMVGIQIFFLC